jgi:small conductance mechanosensitive channel
MLGRNHTGPVRRVRPQADLTSPAEAGHYLRLIIGHYALILCLAIGMQVLLAQEQATPAPTVAAPVSWHAEVVASVRTSFSRSLQSFIRVVPRLIATGLTVLVFWAVAALVRRLAQIVGRAVPNPTLRHLGVQVAYFAVWAIGAVAALDALGVDPQAVATGVGLTGIALGFALKDVLSNIVSGLLILLTRSFEIGDQIVVGDTEGTVERIEVRVTHIRTYDGRLVLVPNAEIFTSRVINNTASPLRRASVIVLLDYQQNLTLALETMNEATGRVRGVADDPPPSVRLRDLTPSHFAIEARFWANAQRADFMNTTCHVRTAIVHALTGAGVALPKPDVQRIVSPGDVERWRSLLEWKGEARLP